jgi:hypothetical protein
MIIDFGILELMKQVSDIAKVQMPELLGKLAKEIFDSKGQSHGRHWNPNKPSTVARKKSSNPNIETGVLEQYLTQPGILEDDNYMSYLPAPANDSQNGYKFANAMRPFDDIGRTPEDEEWLEQQLEIKLQSQLK